MSTAATIRTAASGLVVSDPDNLGGQPVFSGSRLPVRILFKYLAEGLSLKYFLETFDTVTRSRQKLSCSTAGTGYLQIFALIRRNAKTMQPGEYRVLPAL